MKQVEWVDDLGIAAALDQMGHCYCWRWYSQEWKLSIEYRKREREEIKEATLPFEKKKEGDEKNNNLFFFFF